MSNLPATQSDTSLPDAPEGLEDFDTTDQVMPILRINHKEGVFEDSLSKRQYNSINVVILGLVKQRILWPADMGDSESDPPLCKSYDHNTGYPSAPQVMQNGQSFERFPWDASSFSPGTEVLPCSQCPFKDWGTHPKRDAPWCSEMYTLPLLVVDDDGGYAPMLFQTQRSSLKPTKSYLSSFKNSGNPLFTSVTTLGLDERKRGSNEYCVPTYTHSEPSPEEDWPFFTDSYRNIRDFLHTPRSDAPEEDVPDDGLSSPASETQVADPPASPTTPAANPSAAPSIASQPPATASAADDTEELPF